MNHPTSTFYLLGKSTIGFNVGLAFEYMPLSVESSKPFEHFRLSWMVMGLKFLGAGLVAHTLKNHYMYIDRQIDIQMQTCTYPTIHVSTYVSI